MSRNRHVRLDHATIKDATPGVRAGIAADFTLWPNSAEDEQKARLQCAAHATDADELRRFLAMCGLA